jgi:hypothetical protein
MVQDTVRSKYRAIEMGYEEKNLHQACKASLLRDSQYEPVIVSYNKSGS